MKIIMIEMIRKND